jgi:hypothetical protein
MVIDMRFILAIPRSPVAVKIEDRTDMRRACTWCIEG